MGMSNEAEIRKILGIDYGESKVGLAMADNETKIAFVYATLKNDKDFLLSLLKIIEKENIGKVIIGIPAYINRKEVEYAGEKLGEIIRKALPGMEIEYQNEMFTTKMAQDNLMEKGVRGVKKHDDEEAARIILQSWLDKK
jgi:putative holliday junction resolvase